MKDTWGFLPEVRCSYWAMLGSSVALLVWSWPIILLDRRSRPLGTPEMPGVYCLFFMVIWYALMPTVGMPRDTLFFQIGFFFCTELLGLVALAMVLILAVPAWLVSWWIERIKQRRLDRQARGAQPGEVLVVGGREYVIAEVNSDTKLTLESGEQVFVKDINRLRRWARAAKKKLCVPVHYEEKSHV